MFSEILRWGTLAQWDIVATLALIDSYLEWKDARRRYRLASALGNGRVIVAKGNKVIASWFLLGFVIAWITGMLATYSAILLPPPPPDTSIMNSIIREALCVLIFSFWRAKRGNRRMRREFDAQRDAAEILEEKADHLQDTADDTNVRVREMQERGLADQPAERADRAEGHTHRKSE
jgi:hypothetical protein